MANTCDCTLTVRGEQAEILKLREVEQEHLNGLNIWCQPEEMGKYWHSITVSDPGNGCGDWVTAMADLWAVTYKGEARWAPHIAYLGELSKAFPKLVFDLEMLEMNGCWQARTVASNGAELYSTHLSCGLLTPDVPVSDEERQRIQEARGFGHSVDETVARLEESLRKA